MIHSAKSNIEKWGFVNSGNQVVVRSGGENGFAVIELFDTESGKLRKKVMVSEIENGQPSWAAEFTD